MQCLIFEVLACCQLAVSVWQSGKGLLTVVFCCLSVYGSAQTTLIDFEDVGSRTTITTEYAERGVRFEPSDFVDDDPTARSGQNVLRNNNPTDEFETSPMTLVFTSPVSSVSFFAGTHYANIEGTLTAFDADGNEVGQDGPKTVSPAGFTTAFAVSSSEAVIVRARLHYTGTAFESIDDLTFSAPGDIILPTEPPIIESFQVLGNGQGNQLVQPEVLITGTIRGPDVLSPATVSIARPYPEGSLAPPVSNNSITLNNAGETNTFSFPIGLSMGTQIVTLTVENAAGLKSSESQTVNVLPSFIGARLQAEGGPATVGSFMFSGGDSGCRYMVYENAAIAQTGNVTFVVQGAMLEAWTGRTNISSYPKMGCPVAEEVTPRGGVTYQQFTDGTLYLDGQQAYAVPNIFGEVLLNHSREEKEWVPVMETAQSLPVGTELFQRFRRIDHDDPEITLEIIGGPTPTC